MVAAFVTYVPGITVVLLILALACVFAGFLGKMQWQPPMLVLILVEMIRLWPA